MMFYGNLLSNGVQVSQAGSILCLAIAGIGAIVLLAMHLRRNGYDLADLIWLVLAVIVVAVFSLMAATHALAPGYIH